MRREGESMRHYAVRTQLYEEWNQPKEESQKEKKQGAAKSVPTEPKISGVCCAPGGVRLISPDEDLIWD